VRVKRPDLVIPFTLYENLIMVVSVGVDVSEIRDETTLILLGEVVFF